MAWCGSLFLLGLFYFCIGLVEFLVWAGLLVGFFWWGRVYFWFWLVDFVVGLIHSGFVRFIFGCTKFTSSLVCFALGLVWSTFGLIEVTFSVYFFFT